jgi:peptide chain release factor 1
VTVAVFDTVAKVATFNPADVRLEWFSGTGKGGQHRNKHQNSCRAFHEPTGLSAKAECRSRQASETQAVAELERRVLAHYGEGLAGEEAQDRRAQVGSGMRGDKVRTYRLQDDAVTDHRTEKRASWRQIQRGEFDRLH